MVVAATAGLRMFFFFYRARTHGLQPQDGGNAEQILCFLGFWRRCLLLSYDESGITQGLVYLCK